MWLKVCLLLIYITLLFFLTRVLDAIAWCEWRSGGTFSRQLLDPMLMSVAKLKAILEQRGVSYDGVVEKSELTSLVSSTGQVTLEETELAQVDDETNEETSFSSGAHFIEKVEDAKDSVWLVQVQAHSTYRRIIDDLQWKTIKKKSSKFGVRTGIFDCALDPSYCNMRRWHMPFLMLALPGEFEKKASIAMYNYSGPVREKAVMHWMRHKLDETVERIPDALTFREKWQNVKGSFLSPEIRIILFTELTIAPLFFSALSVKFPGRVKFGLISLKHKDKKTPVWKNVLGRGKNEHLPSYVVYSKEKQYLYGSRPGESHSFGRMELFLRFLYPCLNDIFIISFCIANILSILEPFVSNCSFFTRLRKLVWCVVKYNIIVIMLWLPIIAIFQMPYLDQIPLLLLKLVRLTNTSTIGGIIRADYIFISSHPTLLYSSFILYLLLIAAFCNKYRQIEDDTDNWFESIFYHLHPNNFNDAAVDFRTRLGFMGGFDSFTSRISQPSLWLSSSIPTDYIQRLPTWKYKPIHIGSQLEQNSNKVEKVLTTSENNDFERTDTISIEQVTHENIREFHDTMHRKFVEISQLHNRNQETHRMNFNLNVTLNSTTNSQNCRITNNMTVDSLHSTINDSSNGDNQTLINDTSNADRQPLNNDRYASDRVASPINNPSTDNQHSTADNSSNEFHEPPQKVRLSGFPPGFLESHQCVICLEEYSVNVELCGLPCSHVFHETCIISWLNREKHFCPMCRWPAYKPQPKSA